MQWGAYLNRNRTYAIVYFTSHGYFCQVASTHPYRHNFCARFPPRIRWSTYIIMRFFAGSGSIEHRQVYMGWSEYYRLQNGRHKVQYITDSTKRLGSQQCTSKKWGKRNVTGKFICTDMLLLAAICVWRESEHKPTVSNLYLCLLTDCQWLYLCLGIFHSCPLISVLFL